MSPSPLRSNRSATAPISIRDVSNSVEVSKEESRKINDALVVVQSTLGAKLTRANDSVDENFARYQAVVVLVHLAEQVCEARFLVVHEFQELKERRKNRLWK
jgi:hypothetical protein